MAGDTEWGDNLIDILGSSSNNRLSPADLKEKLIKILDIEVEKRLDDDLDSVPEGEEIDQPLIKEKV